MLLQYPLLERATSSEIPVYETILLSPSFLGSVPQSGKALDTPEPRFALELGGPVSLGSNGTTDSKGFHCLAWQNLHFWFLHLTTLGLGALEGVTCFSLAALTGSEGTAIIDTETDVYICLSHLYT